MFQFDPKEPFSLRKKRIRASLLEKRKNLSKIDREEKSRHICEHLWYSSEFSAAKTVLFFAPKTDTNEPDIFPLVEKSFEEKRVCFPRVSGNALHIKEISSLHDLSKGAFGILEPNIPEDINPNKIDLVLVPALGVDDMGNRIGFGGGFYDRFLSQNPLPTLAVVFNFQRIPLLPAQEFDVPVDGVVTERGISVFR